MASLMPNGKQQFFKQSGAPLAGGKIYTYAAGTSTPKSTYSDAAGTAPNANPIILDARGEALVYWSGSYKIALQDSLSGAIYTVDNYVTDQNATLQTALAASSGAGLVGWMQSGAGAIARLIQDKLRESVSVKDYFLAAEANSTGMFQRAIDAVFATGKLGSVRIPGGEYTVGAVTLRPGVDLFADGPSSVTLIPASASMTMFSLINATNLGSNLSLRGFAINNTGGFANVKGVQGTYCNRITLDRINFHGLQRNFEFDRGGNHRVLNCLSGVSGALKAGDFLIWSSTDTEYGGVFTHIEDYRIEGGAVSPACYFRRAVGVTGNIIAPDSGAYTGTCMVIENDCQGITMSGLIAGYNIGVLFQKGAGINKSPIFNSLVEMDFDQNLNGHVVHNAGRQNAIRGGSFTSSDIGTTAKAITVSGADSLQFMLDGSRISGYYGVAGSCVLLDSTSDHTLRNLICDGSYNGIEYAGTVTNTTVFDCDLRTISNNPVIGNFKQAGNYIKDCQGFSAAAFITSPAIPASLATATNTQGVACRVVVYGGSVNAIRINGQLVSVGAGSHIVYPGETIAVEYTGLPSWNWVGI